jgi:hypothetical protein
MSNVSYEKFERSWDPDGRDVAGEFEVLRSDTGDSQ